MHRERSESSDFAAALDEFRLYTKRYFMLTYATTCRNFSVVLAINDRKLEAIRNRDSWDKDHHCADGHDGSAVSTGMCDEAVPSTSSEPQDFALKGTIKLTIGGLQVGFGIPS